MGHDRSCAWQVSQERHLTEALPGPQHDTEMVAVCTDDDPSFTRLDHIESVTGFPLPHDDCSRLELPLLQLTGELGEIDAAELGEQRGSGQRGGRSERGPVLHV
jgi:hypothetical protein